MEKLLHYVWMHKLLPGKTLVTTDGREVEILDPGTHNGNRGPDFSNARIRMDGMMWVGNVEIHTSSGDWFRHGHHTDPVYNTTTCGTCCPFSMTMLSTSIRSTTCRMVVL